MGPTIPTVYLAMLAYTCRQDPARSVSLVPTPPPLLPPMYQRVLTALWERTLQLGEHRLHHCVSCAMPVHGRRNLVLARLLDALLVFLERTQMW